MSTNASISIDADEVLIGQSDDEAIPALGFERLHVSFPAEDMGDVVCRHCGETFDEDDPEPCDAAEEINCTPCLGTGEVLTEEGHEDCPTCDGSGTVHGPHEPEEGPGTWCNSASVYVDDDSVTVTISVGDPRGAFGFTVRKVPTIYEGSGDVANPDLAGRLILHVPYPGEGMAHMTLTELHAGTFLVGD